MAPQSFVNPNFEGSRAGTPCLLYTTAENQKLISHELFGPIGLVVETTSTNESIELAAHLAANHGAISCGAYCTDATVKELIKEAMSHSFSPVAFNFINGIYVNQHAAFSDFHVTGGNPAGNASFTNPDFVNRRFVWVGFREPVQA